MSAAFIPAPVKAPVSKEVLDALDIRIGRIEAVESIEGADRLVALRVGFGDHRRVVVAGIKQERDDVRAIIGMQTAFYRPLQCQIGQYLTAPELGSVRGRNKRPMSEPALLSFQRFNGDRLRAPT